MPEAVIDEEGDAGAREEEISAPPQRSDGRDVDAVRVRSAARRVSESSGKNTMLTGTKPVSVSKKNLGVQLTGPRRAAPYARPVGLRGKTGEGARIPPRCSIQCNGWVPTRGMTQQGT